MRETKFRKFRAFLPAVAGLLLVFCVVAKAQPSEDVRIARLAGLGRLWGAVKFIHPYLAHKDVDWDRALVETISRVNAAKTPAEYNEAINHLLSFLNDPNTRAEVIKETKTAVSTAKEPSKENLVRVADGVFIIDAAGIAQSFAQDNAAFNQLIEKIGAALPQAKAIVLDCRATDEMGEFALFYFDLFTRRMLAQILDSTVTLGSSRSRMHSGYATQTGSTSGGYYSSMVETTPQIIVGRNKVKPPLMAVIVNDKTPPVSDIFSGLQATKRVLIVQEGGDGTELGVSSFTMKLPDDVRVRIRTTEVVNPNGSIGFQADVAVPRGDQPNAALTAALNALRQENFNRMANRAPTFEVSRSVKDDAYANMEFPSTEYRLLALFRFWNIINYFFPYKHLIDEPWANILPRYIPKFEANKDTVEYQQTMHELAAETHDSHVGVRGANKFVEKLGTFWPPIVLKYVEKEMVVAAVVDDKTDVRVGDVVLAVDGERVESRHEQLGRWFAASTPQALARRVSFELLRGMKDSRALLTLRGTNGKTREVSVARTLGISEPKLFQALQRTTPVVQVLPSGFGYVDLARLPVAEVDHMFETIKSTPATIFDMRGYPKGTAWEIAPRLTEKKDVTGATFLRPILEGAIFSEDELTNTSYTFAQKLPKPKGDIYKGKVIMLINEDAISQAEHTCLFFESATDVTFIGTPTVGANGDVTTMTLPGNLIVSFSGHDVRHADGRQLQRLGIQPHIKVEPTKRGIIEGRDEVLETAVKYLQKKLKS
jgi:Peptidase family S41